MKTKYLWLAAGLSSAGALFTGCSEKESPILPIENITIVEEGNNQENNVTNATETTFLGSCGSLRGLLAQTFTNVVNANNAKLIFVDSKELATYKEDVLKAYQRGSVVAIINPDKETVSEFCDENNVVLSADPDDLNECPLTCFNKKSASIIFQKRPKTGDLDDDDVPMVILSSWLDDVISNNRFNNDFRSFDIKKRFAPQKIKQVFTIDLPAADIEQSGWGVHENMTLSTTAEINYQIYPVHSFNDNASFTGDIYLVEGELTIHNGNLYNGRWKYNQGANLYESFGMCLSSCNFSSSLIEKTATGLTPSATHNLMGGPAPMESSNGIYQRGFDWTFNGWITGGSGLESSTPTPIFQGNWTMNNKESYTVKDLAVKAETDGGNVTYTLGVENLPAGESSVIPEIANGNLTFHYSWMWAVPQAADDTDGRYYLQVDMSPIFNWYRMNSSKQIETKQLNPTVKSQKFMLIPPSRKEGQRI